jgi:hypothetical protein
MRIRLRQGQGASCCRGASFFFRRVNYGVTVTWCYSAQMYSRLLRVFRLLASEEIQSMESPPSSHFFRAARDFFSALRAVL